MQSLALERMQFFSIEGIDMQHTYWEAEVSAAVMFLEHQLPVEKRRQLTHCMQHFEKRAPTQPNPKGRVITGLTLTYSMSQQILLVQLWQIVLQLLLTTCHVLTEESNTHV